MGKLDGLTCMNCGSEYRIEMHHVKMMKNLNPTLNDLDKLMVKAKRKQIPLCRKCHMDYHSGKFNINSKTVNPKSKNRKRK